MQSPPRHHVLQLHGGGPKVIAELVKCAILERLTGRRIPELFDTVIADSGGAIIALCLQSETAENVLIRFMDLIPKIMPGRKFYLSQPLPRTANRFSTKALQQNLSPLLGNKTLGDYQGNLFIGAHRSGHGAVTFEKVTLPDGTVRYKEAGPTTRLSYIALKTSLIPGVFNEMEIAEYFGDDPDSETAAAQMEEGQTLLDALINQNPSSIIAFLKTIYPDQEIAYLQMGNIEEMDVAAQVLRRSALMNQLFNTHGRYTVHHAHTGHLHDVRRLLPEGNVFSLTTYSENFYSALNASATQANRIILDVLADVAAKENTYQTLANMLLEKFPSDAREPSAPLSVKDAIKALQDVLDPHMLKQNLLVGKYDVAPDAFPSPNLIDATQFPAYHFAYRLASRFAQSNKSFAGYVIESGFSMRGTLKLAGQSALRRLVPD